MAVLVVRPRPVCVPGRDEFYLVPNQKQNGARWNLPLPDAKLIIHSRFLYRLVAALEERDKQRVGDQLNQVIQR